MLNNGNLWFTGEIQNKFVSFVGGFFAVSYFAALLLTFTRRRKCPAVIPLSRKSDCQTVTEYSVSIYTSAWPGCYCPSSTFVHVNLQGSFHETGFILLKNQKCSRQILSRGSFDIFTISTEETLGDLQSLEVNLKNTTGEVSNWKPWKIEVYRFDTKEKLTTEHIISLKCVHQITRCIPLSKSNKSFSRLQLFFTNLFSFHYWFFFITEPESFGTYTSTVRTLLLFFTESSFLFGNMLCYIVYHEPDEAFSLSYPDYIGCLIALFASCSVAITLEFLLRNIRPTFQTSLDELPKQTQSNKMSDKLKDLDVYWEGSDVCSDDSGIQFQSSFTDILGGDTNTQLHLARQQKKSFTDDKQNRDKTQGRETNIDIEKTMKDLQMSNHTVTDHVTLIDNEPELSTADNMQHNRNLLHRTDGINVCKITQKIECLNRHKNANSLEFTKKIGFSYLDPQPTVLTKANVCDENLSPNCNISAPMDMDSANEVVGHHNAHFKSETRLYSLSSKDVKDLWHNGRQSVTHLPGESMNIYSNSRDLWETNSSRTSLLSKDSTETNHSAGITPLPKCEQQNCLVIEKNKNFSSPIGRIANESIVHKQDYSKTNICNRLSSNDIKVLWFSGRNSAVPLPFEKMHIYHTTSDLWETNSSRSYRSSLQSLESCTSHDSLEEMVHNTDLGGYQHHLQTDPYEYDYNSSSLPKAESVLPMHPMKNPDLSSSDKQSKFDNLHSSWHPNAFSEPLIYPDSVNTDVDTKTDLSFPKESADSQIEPLQKFLLSNDGKEYSHDSQMSEVSSLASTSLESFEIQSSSIMPNVRKNCYQTLKTENSVRAMSNSKERVISNHGIIGTSKNSHSGNSLSRLARQFNHDKASAQSKNSSGTSISAISEDTEENDQSVCYIHNSSKKSIFDILAPSSQEYIEEEIAEPSSHSQQSLKNSLDNLNKISSSLTTNIIPRKSSRSQCSAKSQSSRRSISNEEKDSLNCHVSGISWATLISSSNKLDEGMISVPPEIHSTITTVSKASTFNESNIDSELDQLDSFILTELETEANFTSSYQDISSDPGNSGVEPSPTHSFVHAGGTFDDSVYCPSFNTNSKAVEPAIQTVVLKETISDFSVIMPMSIASDHSVYTPANSSIDFATEFVKEYDKFSDVCKAVCCEEPSSGDTINVEYPSYCPRNISNESIALLSTSASTVCVSSDIYQDDSDVPTPQSKELKGQLENTIPSRNDINVSLQSMIESFSDSATDYTNSSSSVFSHLTLVSDPYFERVYIPRCSNYKPYENGCNFTWLLIGESHPEDQFLTKFLETVLFDIDRLMTDEQSWFLVLNTTHRWCTTLCQQLWNRVENWIKDPNFFIQQEICLRKQQILEARKNSEPTKENSITNLKQSMTVDGCILLSTKGKLSCLCQGSRCQQLRMINQYLFKSASRILRNIVMGLFAQISGFDSICQESLLDLCTSIRKQLETASRELAAVEIQPDLLVSFKENWDWEVDSGFEVLSSVVVHYALRKGATTFDFNCKLDRSSDMLSSGTIKIALKELEEELKLDIMVAGLCKTIIEESTNEVSLDYNNPIYIFTQHSIKQKLISRTKHFVKSDNVLALIGKSVKQLSVVWRVEGLDLSVHMPTLLVQALINNLFKTIDDSAVISNLLQLREIENKIHPVVKRTIRESIDFILNSVAQDQVLNTKSIFAMNSDILAEVLNLYIDISSAAMYAYLFRVSSNLFQEYVFDLACYVIVSEAIQKAKDSIFEHQKVDDKSNSTTVMKLTTPTDVSETFLKMQSFKIVHSVLMESQLTLIEDSIGDPFALDVEELTQLNNDLKPLRRYAKYFQSDIIDVNKHELQKELKRYSKQHQEYVTINLHNIADSYYLTDSPPHHSKRNLYLQEWYLTGQLDKYLAPTIKAPILFLLFAFTLCCLVFISVKGAELTITECQEWICLYLLTSAVFAFVITPIKVMVVTCLY